MIELISLEYLQCINGPIRLGKCPGHVLAGDINFCFTSHSHVMPLYRINSFKYPTRGAGSPLVTGVVQLDKGMWITNVSMR